MISETPAFRRRTTSSSVRRAAPVALGALPVRSPRRRPEDAAHLGDGGIPAALTRLPPHADPPVEAAGPGWDSAGAGQRPAPVPAPDG